MHDRLIETLDIADTTLADAAGFVTSEALEAAAHLVRRARNRLAYPEDLAIVALVGGTGSGKSSLFNRILDREVAEVGGLRPTTAKPLASTPESRRDVIDSYVRSLGELRRTSHPGLPWLTLIDLPDTDSVEVDHRLQVEALLPKVDVVVWVSDVEKYRDEVLHRDFIGPLQAYQGQFLFVLNQVDRVPKAEVADLVRDFESALTDDGINEPDVVPVAANPPLTPPYNIDRLRDRLKGVANGSVLLKILNDLQVAIDSLGDAGASGSLDFDSRWSSIRDEVARDVAGGDLIGPCRRLATFFLGLVDELSGEAAEAALELSAHIGEDVRAIVQSLGSDHSMVGKRSRRRWWRGADIRSADSGDPGSVARELDGLISARLRPSLRQRAVVVANLARLSVAVAETRKSYLR